MKRDLSNLMRSISHIMFKSNFNRFSRTQVYSWSASDRYFGIEWSETAPTEETLTAGMHANKEKAS
jgi:hypothetical protein